MGANTRGKATAILIVAQVLFIVLFGLFVDYAEVAGPKPINSTGHAEPQLATYYPLYQDVHVMIFVGFGFLMTFLAYHGFGSVGFNFLLATYVIEWATLVNGWFKLIGTDEGKIKLEIFSFIEADFAAATVLISFGGILGKASPVQLIVMATLEVVFYNISIYVGVGLLKVFDVGGSIFIHAFGAYFGLAVSRMLYKKAQTTSAKETSIYHSDIFAMIGTIFLWLFWPSFNSAPALDHERHRAVINTILSLSACTVTTFAISAVVNKDNKINMVHVQNATLAGGVMMGASADLIVHPFGCLLCGTVAASVSTLGYQYLQPLLADKLKIHDTCGIHNLHGMPGVLGAIMGSIVFSMASRDLYQGSYDKFFLDGRTPQTQAGFQIAALVCALGIAIVSGALTGLLLKLLPGVFDAMSQDDYYDDSVFWDAVEEQPKEEAQKPDAVRVVGKDEEAMAQTSN